jgi:hypothetical protein
MIDFFHHGPLRQTKQQQIKKAPRSEATAPNPADLDF